MPDSKSENSCFVILGKRLRGGAQCAEKIKGGQGEKKATRFVSLISNYAKDKS
jgi:hypothetical protein